MVKVLNLLRQPLAVNINEKESIIFLSREIKELEMRQFKSVEVQRYIDKKILLVLEINE